MRDNLVPVSSIEGDRKREEVPRRDAMVELERGQREVGGRDKGSYIEMNGQAKAHIVG